MKKYFLLLAFFPAVFLIRSNGDPSVESNYRDKENEPREKEIPGEADEWLYAQKVFPYDKVDRHAQQLAVKHTLEQKKKNKLARTEGATEDWKFIGPLTIGGRIADIDCPAGNDNTIYVGTASGGVLKSYDKGNSWISIFDDNTSLSIGDLAIDPVDTNIVYVGTGEPDCGVGSVTYDGDGVYKSTDGGETWMNIGLSESGNTGRIAINPQNTQIVFAAMLGNLFENNSERGIYRSENGGETWEQVLYINDSTGGIDVAINPDDPDIIYATTWERVRRFYRKDYAGNGSRIYRSENGGDTWEMLTNGLPMVELCKISLALCPSSPETIYAGVLGSNEKLRDIYKTTDGGDTWAGLNCDDEVIVGTTDFWYAGVKVDPNNANEVFWIGFESSRSTNGGDTWTQFANSTHVDHQAFYISPTDHNFKILGGDGGLNFSSNNFTTYTLDQNIPVTQLYTLDVYPGDTSELIFGAQDNGCFRKDPSDNWFSVNGGDGVSARFVPFGISISYYANYQYGGYYGVVNGAEQLMLGYDFGDRHNWRSPLEVNPLNPATIYFGGSKIQRTINYGNNLTTISDDLTNGNQGIGLTFGTIFTIHNAPADTNYIYAGTDDANVWRSKDYGDNWELITDGLPYRYCMSIETDPNDAEIVYVSFSGFRWADDAAHIYRSEDAGETWENISGDMPDIPVNDIQIAKYPGDTTTLLVATDVGCYYSFNDGENWTLLGSEMPIVSVYEIYYDGETNTLFAGTYGRGAWKIAVPEQEPPVIQHVEDAEIKMTVYPNPASDYLFIHTDQLLQNAVVTIYNLQGEKVFETVAGNVNQLSVSLEQFTAGNYFVEIKEDGRSVVRKMTVI